MGSFYNLKCSKCDYGISITEGYGFVDSSVQNVFYECCTEPGQNWDNGSPNSICETGKPFLLKLVDEQEIKDKAIALLAEGAKPVIKWSAGKSYGRELYVCPNCMLLYNKFYFCLESPETEYEPDYRCNHCDTTLLRANAEDNFENGKARNIICKNNQKLDWKCPKCGNNELISDGGGLWD